MSPRTATRISRAILLTAAVCIAVTIPAGIIAAADGQRTSIIVVPAERAAEIEASIEQGGGCPNPTTDGALADAPAVSCELTARLEAGPLSKVTLLDPFNAFSLVIGLLWITTGYLIVSRRGSNLAGWTFQAVGLTFLVSMTALSLVYVGVNARPGSVPWIGLWAALGEYVFLAVALLPMLWLLFPDGVAPSPRWRTWIRVYFAVFGVTLIVAALMPGPLNNLVEFGIIYMNPIGLPLMADLGGAILALGVITVLGIAVASIVSTRRRFKRSTGEERQQLRWLKFVITVAVVLFVLTYGGGVLLTFVIGDTAPALEWWFGGLFLLLAITLAFGLPAAYLIAMFRHGLWDLDLVIRKTLIVAAVGVTLTVIGFGLLVMIPIAVLGTGGSAKAGDLLPVIIGLVLGLLFGPVRRRARRFADRVVYGQRATPYEILSSFGDRLSETYAADDVMPRTAQVLAQATGAARAVVWLRIGDVLRPEARWPIDAPAPAPEPAAGERPPGFAEVRHQGELLGALSVTMPANDPLDPAREQLVADLAAQAGLVLRNVRLIEELRASRQRLVAAQDEERRKLERDIHDGVQQQLVALSVQLRLAEQLTDRDPAKAKGVLAGLQSQATDALEELRDLARGIYPPLLADKGLAAALGAQARKAVVPTTVEADGLGRYPRDVEATVYFCTLEAMNNIAKYAEASAARISLAQRNDTLEFEVHDDGRGFDTSAVDAGTGLQGIEDRLDALGGRLTIESRPGHGTIVRGELPVAG